MKIIFRALLAPALLLTAGAATAQTSKSDPVDVQSRLGAALKWNLPRRWEASLEYQARFVDNASVYRGSYISAEGGYSFSKHLKALANYRLALTTKDHSNRYGLGLEVSEKWGKWSLAFRPMAQYLTRYADDEETSRETNLFVRTRLQAKYALLKKLDLYASLEPYFVFDGAYPIDNWRNTLGLKYEYAQNKKIDLYYIYRPDYAKSYNWTFHVVGMNFDFSLKAKKK
ncbi:DUF2490 domain-containing protein [Paraflavisolibacter sp. H34]|uniref:DUF2490 domain-containing protein n=1 Tax=Huijunlia imazamoxiresistens TaxID=3127457 RepID=UPI00301B19BB